MSWKRVQGATGKLQVGGCGLYIFLYLKILTRALTTDDELLPEFQINYFRLLVFASTATQMLVKDRLD